MIVRNNLISLQYLNLQSSNIPQYPCIKNSYIHRGVTNLIIGRIGYPNFAWAMNWILLKFQKSATWKTFILRNKSKKEKKRRKIHRIHLLTPWIRMINHKIKIVKLIKQRGVCSKSHKVMKYHCSGINLKLKLPKSLEGKACFLLKKIMHSNKKLFKTLIDCQY